MLAEAWTKPMLREASVSTMLGDLPLLFLPSYPLIQPLLGSCCTSVYRSTSRAQASMVKVVTIPAVNRSTTARCSFSLLQLLILGLPMAWARQIGVLRAIEEFLRCPHSAAHPILVTER